MILQALYRLAQDEHLMEDPDFEWKPIAWLVTVGPDGEWLGLQGTATVPSDAPAGKKPKPRAKNFLVPRESGRTSGDRAFLLFDKAEYAVGLDPEGERPAEKLAVRLGLFHARAAECFAATQDPGVRAVERFLERRLRGEVTLTLPAGCASNDLFGFVYAPDLDQLVTSRPAVRRYWQSLRAGDESTEPGLVQCLVSGLPCSPVAKHPLLKNVPGGTTSGVALVSFNSNAFDSFGLSGNENAPVSRAASEACATALNRLLHPAFPSSVEPGVTLPRRNLRLSDTTVVCYWSARSEGDDLTSYLAGLLEGDPAQVGELYRSIWHGRPVALEDSTAFFALTLSGAQGRAILRDWLESSVARAEANLAQHFRDLEVCRNTPPPRERGHPPVLPLRLLLRSLGVLGDDKSIPAALAADLVQAALAGTPYPLALLQRAVERTRAEIGQDDWSALERRDARAALIKAVLNRRRRFQLNRFSFPEIGATVDPENPDLTSSSPAYALGRLMAVIERMQQIAINDPNASVVDRFFGAASATPRAVFPRLLKGLRHHARKALDDKNNRGQAIRLERETDRILTSVDPALKRAYDQWLAGSSQAAQSSIAAFPAYFSLEEQGLFILGYHHQRSWIWTKQEAREALAPADPSAAAAERDAETAHS